MKLRETKQLWLYLLFDLLIINAAIIATASYYFGISAWEFKTINMYILHANLSWLTTYFIFLKNDFHLRNDFLNRLWRITKRMIIFLFVALVIAFLIMPRGFSRLFILEYIILIIGAKVVFYFLLNRYLYFRLRKKLNVDNCLIIDCGETGQMLKRVLKTNPLLGYRFDGFLSDDYPEALDVRGRTEELSDIIDSRNIHVVFIVISLFGKNDKAKNFMKICNHKGVRIYFVPENQRWFANMAQVGSIGGVLFFNPQEIPLDDYGSRIQKRLFDVVFSIAAILFVFTWLFPIIALLIKLSSKGPVFFVQKRTGINNRTFNCLKFRSMKVNKLADEQQASATDQRITKIGHFMRKTNIDELPQFLNVLIGNMSVVGPRPHMLKHTDEYSELIKYYKTRHYVKPGITGLAQVSGFRGETKALWKMERRVECDMEYIENWTFKWDIKIIWLTIFGKEALENAG